MSADLCFPDPPIKETLLFSAHPLDYYIFQPWLHTRALSADVFFCIAILSSGLGLPAPTPVCSGATLREKA